MGWGGVRFVCVWGGGEGGGRCRKVGVAQAAGLGRRQGVHVGHEHG